MRHRIRIAWAFVAVDLTVAFLMALYGVWVSAIFLVGASLWMLNEVRRLKRLERGR